MSSKGKTLLSHDKIIYLLIKKEYIPGGAKCEEDRYWI